MTDDAGGMVWRWLGPKSPLGPVVSAVLFIVLMISLAGVAMPPAFWLFSRWANYWSTVACQ